MKDIKDNSYRKNTVMKNAICIIIINTIYAEKKVKCNVNLHLSSFTFLGKICHKIRNHHSLVIDFDQ